MSRLFRVLLIASLLVGLAPVLPAAAQAGPLPPSCGITPAVTGALWVVCLPPYPNGDLVVFAHGYVAPGEPLAKFAEQLFLPDGSTIPGLVLSMGYTFAATSYPKNGLAVREGLADIVELVRYIKTVYPLNRVYLIGASEGGLITTLAAEKEPSIDGGLALCGPIGNFRSQINYWGDFRVLFDYFYKNVLPPSPIAIPDDVMLNWNTVYTPTIISLMMNPANQTATAQLLKTSRAPIDPADPSTAIATTVGILSYNVFATNDAKVELGGQPFGNRYTWYFGSNNDRALNKRVQRFDADPTALAEISRYYETSGKLIMPLVTMHTTGDPIVPYWHEMLYTAKTLFGGTPLKHVNIPIVRYGHCNFTASEAVAAFGILVYRVIGLPPANVTAALPTSKLQQDFADLVRQYQPDLPLNPR